MRRRTRAVLWWIATVITFAPIAFIVLGGLWALVSMGWDKLWPVLVVAVWAVVAFWWMQSDD